MQACSSFVSLTDDLQKSHRACSDAFGVYRVTFDESLRRMDATIGATVAEGARDLWLLECVYKSEVAAFHEKLMQVRAACVLYSRLLTMNRMKQALLGWRLLFS